LEEDLVTILTLTLATVLALAAAAWPPLGLADATRFQVFKLPAGDYPHDVSPGPDGTIYYADQQQGGLGIVTPATGQVEKVDLGKGSAPHGVITGPGGVAWLTDGGQNAIASYDPRTRKVAVHKLPEDAAYANLNTAAFDRHGDVWFTGQSGIYGKVAVKT